MLFLIRYKFGKTEDGKAVDDYGIAHKAGLLNKANIFGVGILKKRVKRAQSLKPKL